MAFSQSTPLVGILSHKKWNPSEVDSFVHLDLGLSWFVKLVFLQLELKSPIICLPSQVMLKCMQKGLNAIDEDLSQF